MKRSCRVNDISFNPAALFSMILRMIEVMNREPKTTVEAATIYLVMIFLLIFMPRFSFEFKFSKRYRTLREA